VTKAAGRKDRQQVHEFVFEGARVIWNPLEELSSQLRLKEAADSSLWMFALEVFERDHPICSDIGKTPVQRSQRLFIQRWTVSIGGIAKVFQQIAGLLIGKPVDQLMKLFFDRHDLIVTP
jgi:hypothetical protein